jgi:hypothetical protein
LINVINPLTHWISAISIRIVVVHPSFIFSYILIVIVIPLVVVLLAIRSNALRFFPGNIDYPL